MILLGVLHENILKQSWKLVKRLAMARLSYNFGMGNLSISVTAESLGKSLDNLGEALEAQMREAVGQLALQTQEHIIESLYSMTNADRGHQKEYQEAVKFTQLGEASWLISLDGEWPNQLELGFQPAGRDKLLASKKIVSAGSRSGLPWVQHTKERVNKSGEVTKPSHKFAYVPFEHHPYSGEKKFGGGDLAKDLANIFVLNPVTGIEQSFMKNFYDASGNALTGKVAVAKGPSLSKNAQGMTKYQYQYPQKVESVYMTFRTVSELSTGWNPKRFGGYQLFDKAEKWAEAELEKIIRSML